MTISREQLERLHDLMTTARALQGDAQQILSLATGIAQRQASLANAMDAFFVELRKDHLAVPPYSTGYGDNTANWVRMEEQYAQVLHAQNLMVQPHHPPATGDHRLPTFITYLQMHAHPTGEARAQLGVDEGRSVVLISNSDPTARIKLSRYWYNRVGRPWLWYERNTFTDVELHTYLRNPNVEFLALTVNGKPAGYAELDWRDASNVELAFFGLFPEFIGKGYGKWFLDYLVDRVWLNTSEVKRFWVYTNVLDGIGAMPNYIRAGFRPYQSKSAIYVDPRTMWPNRMTRYEYESYPWPKDTGYTDVYDKIAAGQ